MGLLVRFTGIFISYMLFSFSECMMDSCHQCGGCIEVEVTVKRCLPQVSL